MNFSYLNLGDSVVLAAANKLEDALKDVMKDVHPAMIKDAAEGLIAISERTLDLIKKHAIVHVLPWDSAHPRDKLFLTYIDRGFIPGSPQIDPAKANLKPDARVLAEKDAARHTDAILNNFYSKVLAKLNKVIERVGDPVSITKNYGSQTGSSVVADLHFMFANKSEFSVRTQIVFVWNEKGTQFSRYPLTFHNVKLSDGTKMKSPSEKKMIEEFK